MANQQAPRPGQKQGQGQEDHNRKEHEERLAREAERVKPGTPGFNEHNAKEHEDKMRREAEREV